MKKKSDAYKTIKEAEAEAPNAGKIEEEYIKKAVDRIVLRNRHNSKREERKRRKMKSGE